MAHLITGYAGYEHIQSADEGAFNAAFFGKEQYVLDYGNKLSGSIIDNNTVRILDGEGLMYGRHFRIDPNTYEDVTITTGTAGTNRIDLICMNYEKSAEDETEKVYLHVIKGMETQGTAVAPEYTDGNILEGASFNNMPLYKVKINGVVLESIEPLFELLPSYQQIAAMYAERFEAACEEIKASFTLDNMLKRTDVVDNLESDATDLPLSAKQGKLLNAKTDIELLWTNASPTSSFVKQDINLDLSKYRFVLIVFKRSGGSTKYVTCIAHIGGSNVALFMEGNPQTRSYTPTTTNINFEEGLTWSGLTSPTIDNNMMIPYQIYGIK